MEESHWMAIKRTMGVAMRAQLMPSSASSTTDSKAKDHEMARKMKTTKSMNRTGYGKGLRVKASVIDDCCLLP